MARAVRVQCHSDRITNATHDVLLAMEYGCVCAYDEQNDDPVCRASAWLNLKNDAVSTCGDCERDEQTSTHISIFYLRQFIKFSNVSMQTLFRSLMPD